MSYPLLLSYERDVGGRGKGPAAKELSLSVVLVGTIVRNALTGKAWFLPEKAQMGMVTTDNVHILKGNSSSSKKEEQFIPPCSGFGESAPTGFQLVLWYLCQYQACFWQQKKVPSILNTKLCSLEKVTNKSKIHASDSGLVDLPYLH